MGGGGGSDGGAGVGGVGGRGCSIEITEVQKSQAGKCHLERTPLGTNIAFSLAHLC